MADDEDIVKTHIQAATRLDEDSGKPLDGDVTGKDGEVGADFVGWDDGLNKGLIIRKKVGPLDPGNTADERKKHEEAKKKKPLFGKIPPPEYYGESGPPVRFAKAIGLAFVAIVPYFTVLDTLGHIKPMDFEPCNNSSCHYMRIFRSVYLPGTGVDVMQVHNGVERPVALHYATMEAYSCPFVESKHLEMGGKSRQFKDKAFGKNSQACPAMKKHEVASFLQDHEETKQILDEEDDKASAFTFTLRSAFYFTKYPLCIFAWPINLASKYNPFWGMEHVPSARCKGLSPDEMRAKCVDPSVQGEMINHLKPMTPAKIVMMGGLAGYACLTAAHDVMLLMGKPEMYTLRVGFLAVISLGCAAMGMFLWAMGAAGVFISPVSYTEDGFIDCACYYHIPEITALVALATPFGLFASFAGKVQMQGLASLFGDYLSYQTYTLPHYLAKQSFLWTWALTCSPKMAGTIVGKKRQLCGKEVSESEEEKAWKTLQDMQQVLFYMMLLVQAVVALAASTFMIAFKELSISLYLRGDMTPAVQNVIKWVILPLPSVVVGAVGLYAAYEIFDLVRDAGEDGVNGFYTQLDTLLPRWMGCLIGWMEGSKVANDAVAWTFFVIAESILAVWTCSAVQGLSPDKSFLFGNEELQRPRLAQAELWGGCGFIFFFVHIPRVMAIAFSTWEDLESLRNLSVSKDIQDDIKKGLQKGGKHLDGKDRDGYQPFVQSDRVM